MAVDLNPPEVQTRVNAALQYAYGQEYDSAQAVLDRLVQEQPENPAGYFLTGALWQLYMFDMGSDSLEGAFLACMQQAQDKATKVLKQEVNAQAHLCLGSVYTYRAIYYGWKGNYWRTYAWGTKAPREMQKALELDPALTDACLALGVSEYFHYCAGRYLTGLNLFGSLTKGVELVNRAIAGNGYFALTARYALAWMWGHEKRYRDAEAILRDLLETYPDNRLFRKLLRDTYYAHRDYGSAITVAQELGDELAGVMPGNIQAQAENYLTWAKSLYDSGDRLGARACCDSIIEWEPQQKKVLGLADFVRAAKTLRRKT
jgi:tetratricopeptide (TPR) repeat protein